MLHRAPPRCHTRRTPVPPPAGEDRAHILRATRSRSTTSTTSSASSLGQGRGEARQMMARYRYPSDRPTPILELRLYQLPVSSGTQIEASTRAHYKLIEEVRSILDRRPNCWASSRKSCWPEGKVLPTPAHRDHPAPLANPHGGCDPNEGCVMTVSHLGFIKRTPVADYRSQRRGGKGSSAPRPTKRTRQDLFTASPPDFILFPD